MDILTNAVLLGYVDEKSAKAALNQAIEEVIRTEFTDAAVHAVHFQEGRDDDDDLVLWVTVVFETSAKPDARKAATLVRHLRPVLEQRHSEAFPLVAFRSRAEHDRLSEAA